MSFFIQYTPSLMKRLGSDRSAILFERLEYWFKRYSSGFYKFITACQHPCYREGDSWEEELGFSRAIFNHAFDRIGIRYKSKTDFESQQDPFKGKYFAMYMDRQSHRTFFVRNHSAIQALSDQVKSSIHPVEPITYPLKQSSPTVSELSHLLNSRNSTKHHSNKYRIQTITSSSFQKEDQLFNKHKTMEHLTPSKTLQESSLGDFKDDMLQHNPKHPVKRLTIQHESYDVKPTEELTSIHDLDKKLSEDGVVDQTKQESNITDIPSRMLHIWTTLVGEFGGNLSPHSSTIHHRLTMVLAQSFQGSLNLWRSYCRKIASSKFLMGEGRNQSFKKAWLLWAIKPETLDRIQHGAFVLGDRIIPEAEDVRQLKRTLADLRKQRESIHTMLKELDLDRTKAIQWCTRELKANLTLEQLEGLQQEFVGYLKECKPNLYSEFQDRGWDGLCIDITFDLYLQEALNRIDPESHQKIHELMDQKHATLSEHLLQLTEQERVLSEQLRDRELTISDGDAEEIALCA